MLRFNHYTLSERKISSSRADVAEKEREREGHVTTPGWGSNQGSAAPDSTMTPFTG